MRKNLAISFLALFLLVLISGLFYSLSSSSTQTGSVTTLFQNSHEPAEVAIANPATSTLAQNNSCNCEGNTPLPTTAGTLPPATPVITVPVTVTAMPTDTPIGMPTVMPTATPTDTIVYYTYKVLNSYPHDPDAFTQGLVYLDGGWYEGTGLRGRSSLRRVDFETGEVLQQVDLPAQYFGEGIVVFGEKIYQLTWQSKVGFIYDKSTFEQLDEFAYETEGWGFTHDGERLIMSDGSSTIYFMDPENLAVISQISVTDDRGPVRRLNELEYIDGQIYANVWQTNRIARIDPASGQVTAWIDLTNIFIPAEHGQTQPHDVLNGIAYDDENQRLFVTGKLWSRIFEIELVESE